MAKTINELECMLEREKTARLICSELNNFVDIRNSLITVLKHIRILTGCEAVGIRLHADGDYPYFVYEGFPESFIQKENSLCARDKSGKLIPIPSADGRGYLLECMCGNIIQGRFDPKLSFFTPNGSFWSNNTTALLASSTKKDRLVKTRNYCNVCGYESVALIPLKSQGERVGLIQLNDKRVDMFNKELIEYVEMIGEQIGTAVRNSLIYRKSKQNEELMRSLFEYSPIEKTIVDRNGRIMMFNREKRNSGSRLPNIGDVMYKDYASRHERDMHTELILVG